MDSFENNYQQHSGRIRISCDGFFSYYPEKLNMEKVMFLLLIHDLGEIYAGDTARCLMMKKGSCS